MQNQSEEWKPVVGFEGKYEVSSHGRVRSLAHQVQCKGNRRLKKGRMLRLWSGERGYVFAYLGGKAVKVQHLVLKAFVGPRPPGHECCHFPDRDPANNRLDNLKWGTHAENMSHMKIHGTIQRGEEKCNVKLTDAKVRKIRRLREHGLTIAEIGQLLRIANHTVTGVVCGYIWRHIK